MEISAAVVSRQVPCFSGVSTSKPSFPVASGGRGGLFAAEFRGSGFRDLKLCLRPRRVSGVPDRGFRDNGHLDFYMGPTCGAKKELVKEKKGVKKQLKLLKNLSKNLTMFSQSGFGIDSASGLVGEVQSKTIEDATEVLLRQLKQLKAEEKELKKKKKQEKSKRMKTAADCKESSDSSSESSSSDSECGEVIDMSSMRSNVLAQQTPNQITSQPITEDAKPILNELNPIPQGTSTLTLPTPSSHKAEDCSSKTSTSSMVNKSAVKKIEVCMGGKCKRSGAAALLEEFGKVMGVEGAVVGCKCMGKCRDGPNVRVLSGVSAEAADNSVRSPTNPLCIGVGLDDVNVIMSKFFGEDGKDMCMPQIA